MARKLAEWDERYSAEAKPARALPAEAADCFGAPLADGTTVRAWPGGVRRPPAPLDYRAYTILRRCEIKKTGTG